MAAAEVEGAGQGASSNTNAAPRDKAAAADHGRDVRAAGADLETGAAGPGAASGFSGSGRFGAAHLIQPAALVAAALALVHLPLLFGQVYFYRDVGRWLFPARAFVLAARAAGESPLYNPAQGLGLAVAASPLHGVWYPVWWLPGASARALSYLLVLHLAWGAAGMMLLGTRFGLPRAPAALAALAWALSGPLTAAFTAGQLLPAAAWLPWCALGAIALARRLPAPETPARGRALGGVAWAALAPAAALLLGEVFQAALATGLGALLAVVWWFWEERARAGRVPRAARPGSARFALRAVGAGGAALALAGALAAIALLPLGRAARETERGAGLSREVAEKWSLHPLRLVELVAPGAMGDPYGVYPGGRWAGDGASDDRPLLYGVYLGASVLVLALAGLGAGGVGRTVAAPVTGRAGRHARLALVSLALLAVLLALGRHTPLHALLRGLLPLFAYQRAPEKFVLAAVPLLALAAGWGAQRVCAKPGALRGPALATGGFLLALQALPLLWTERVAATIATGARHGLVAVLALAGVVWLGPRLVPRRPRLVAALLPAVVALDLGLAALPLLIFAPASLLDQPPALAQLARARFHGPGRPRVVRDPSVEGALSALARGRGVVALEALRYATLRPGFLTAHALTTLPGYDAGLPPALERIWQAGQANALALMRLLAVDFVVLPVPASAAPPGLQRVDPPGSGVPGVGLFRVENTLPRAYVALHAAPLAPSAPPSASPPLERLFSDDVIAGTTVLFDPASVPPSPLSPPPTLAAAPPASAHPCALTTYRHTEIAATCTSPAAAHAVFVEQFGAGWTATVDGHPAPILRANTLMRAVPIPPGRHDVVLRYEQPGLRAGATITVAAALVVLFLLGFAWRSRRESTPAARA
jgi:hypothetical protein